MFSILDSDCCLLYVSLVDWFCILGSSIAPLSTFLVTPMMVFLFSAFSTYFLSIDSLLKMKLLLLDESSPLMNELNAYFPCELESRFREPTCFFSSSIATSSSFIDD